MNEEQLPRVKRGEKPSWRGKWENAISGKQLDYFQEETLVASVMSKHPETDADIELVARTMVMVRMAFNLAEELEKILGEEK